LSILRDCGISVILRYFIGMFRMNRVFPQPVSTLCPRG
jgi:hypothetical protein